MRRDQLTLTGSKVEPGAFLSRLVPEDGGSRRRKRRSGRFPHFRRRYPEARFWLRAGFGPKSARALAEAGFLSLADLEGATREQLRAIAGVGRTSLELIEQLLGRPLPRYEEEETPKPATPSPKLKIPPPRPLLAEELWRRRGVPPAAAIRFAQAGMTMGRLKTITREELLGMYGVGRSAVRACELLVGREIPSRKTADPKEAFWRDRGIPAKASRSLSKAGIGSLEDLRKHSREELLALPGIGGMVIGRLEALSGSEIFSRCTYWLGRGVSTIAAHALIREEIYTLDQLGTMSREEFLARPGLGPRALRQCERALGRRLASAWQYWREQGFASGLARKLARAGVNTLAELESAGDGVLRAAYLDASEIELCKMVGSHAGSRND